MAPSLLFTMFYMLTSLCFVFPPNEFVSAGFTVQCIFASWLGSENEFFIQYHMRRIIATIFSHSLLPLGYLLGLFLLGHSNPQTIFWQGGAMWQLYIFASVLMPSITAYFIWKWSRDNWNSHPVAKALSCFCNPNSGWSSVASDINIEFRRIDKICIETNSVVKVIATDNWIVKVSPYWLDVAHQSDAALILSSSDTHQVAPSSPGGAQYLNIEVKSVRPGVKPFRIRLNALDFRDLQDKVSRPITVLQNVTFHLTLVDRFLEAFREQVAQNAVYETSQELEPCIGCMQTQSNVKLQNLCGGVVTQDDACNTCYCRPMWCLDCMGKWFASRQDQDRPETWLSSKCTCPLCRSRFCILDVCQVVQR
ncbi:E3 ubiquitin-protein ligase TM129 [Periplaneta americana]|uniref:E3 ubiquitin-protein ligase TM129 n=1 Tax=Periplaneta americana TaxID=6978 RepID=UPI0037E95382